VFKALFLWTSVTGRALTCTWYIHAATAAPFTQPHPQLKFSALKASIQFLMQHKRTYYIYTCIYMPFNCSQDTVYVISNNCYTCIFSRCLMNGYGSSGMQPANAIQRPRTLFEDSNLDLRTTNMIQEPRIWLRIWFGNERDSEHGTRTVNAIQKLQSVIWKSDHWAFAEQQIQLLLLLQFSKRVWVSNHIYGSGITFYCP
jgi:hypothetical protein